MTINNDGPFDIAIGKSRKEVHWKNKEMLWSDFLARISTTHRTAERYSEYMSAKKIRQDEIKDVGGFVGGYVNEGRRKSENILHRQLITLDIDFATTLDIWDAFCSLYDNAAAIYSTHKHCPEHPRLRLIMPLDRPVTTDEYVAIARRIAGNLDINAFDDTTYEPARLMYWPSTAKDAEYIFNHQDGPWLNADDTLASYRNWRDSSEWPVSDRSGEVIHREIKKQGDPTEKGGIIGTFCREYSIYEAIDTFLPDIYEATADEDRYTYHEGSTSAGLVVYSKGLYAYSHHGTDPASGKLSNSFDLVRIHLYGIRDEDAKPGTSVNHMPSFMAMVEHASNDPRVRRRIGIERLESSRADFADSFSAEIDTDWMAEMDADKKGNYRNTIDNIMIVLNNDPNLKGKLALNTFEQREVAKTDLPWRNVGRTTKYLSDRDDAGIRHYLEKIYNLTGTQRIQDAVNLIVEKNAYNPVREYLSSVKWDGSPRVNSLLIDYLGAKDCEYTRTVTRKTLVAAVTRVFRPGCKFDYVLVLIGDQGVGKSTLVRMLGRDWYSDTFLNVQGKEAFEQIQGVWIMEIAELAAFKKAEMEQIKHFISKAEDRYRVAYGKRIDNFPRQCIFIGTNNKRDFLLDPTGNRRFWPVDTYDSEPTKDVFSITAADIDQIWAEAVQMYKAGEAIHLDKDLELEARKNQAEHAELDDRVGLIQKYLDTPLPSNWYDLDINNRRSFLSGDDLMPEGRILRERVCIAEIWAELFGKPQSEMTRYNTKDLHAIMKNMEGWEESRNGTARFKIYGTQKYYSRKFVNEVRNLVYKSGDLVYKSENVVYKSGEQNVNDVNDVNNTQKSSFTPQSPENTDPF